MRKATYQRKTRETDITVEVNLDGAGDPSIDTGIPFLDHMLTSLSTHSLIDLTVQAKGDLTHHTAEDTAICIGEALNQALGDRSGITSFGYTRVPMDCSLAEAAIDLGNRPYSVINLKTEGYSVEGMAAEDLVHFIRSLADSLRANIHVHVVYGENDHHKAEAAFKALARSLRAAVSMDPRRAGVPSSKGVL